MNEIQGWLDPGVANAMRDLIYETKPSVCVEIGVFAGKSLVNTAEALAYNSKGMVYGIDPWNSREAIRGMSDNDNDQLWHNIDLDAVHYDCMRSLWNNGLDAYAVIIRATSHVAKGLFPLDSIDILYIDGAHSAHMAAMDVINYTPRVRRNGYIWLDDTDWPSLKTAMTILSGMGELVKDYGQCRLYRRL
jgi:hypothetical protein